MTQAPIALTGATGFIGTHLMHGLLSSGYRVLALHRRLSSQGLPTHPELTWISTADADDIFRVDKPQAVIHLATCYGHTETLSELVSTNVIMPLRLLELSIANECKLFINTDSYFSKPEFNYRHMRPYIESKNSFLSWTNHLLEGEPSLTFVNARLEHVYGPNDSASKFVPHALDKILRNRSLRLSPGDQIRDFIYVSDVVLAYLKILSQAAKLPSSVKEFEIGTGRGHTVREFVETAKSYSASSSNLEFGALPHRKGEIMASVADVTNISQLGWRPLHTLKSGIAATIDATSLKN